MNNEKKMDIGQVAARFGVSTRTVHNWYKSGKTCLEAWQPHHLIGSRGIRFTKRSVDEFEARGRLKPELCEKGTNK